MKLSRAMAVIAVLTASTVLAGCGSGQKGNSGGETGSKQVTMDEQQATKRAEDILHQAVDGMSPKPTLKRTGLNPVGACLADDHSAGERRQVTLSYQLTGVPGTEAKKLVRQARDAWVKRGYTFQSADADWSDPFPTVNMRTVPDDFWMTALTGVVDKAKGEGLAAISITSPCFAAGGSAAADPASAHQTAADERAQRLARDHSSRLYDALQVRHAARREGEGLATYQDGEDRYAHHAWSTEPLTEEAMAQALARARTHFESQGWRLGQTPTAAGAPALLAGNPVDGSAVRVAPSTDGTLRVAVTTPAAGPEAESV
ncbi:hypothetical protein FRZ03_02925 [Streptomyces misionensis]|uniref:Lipoprotein n=1 Tax=Streptomyces misionensis TaxID=67331 RepID=A0A5C6K411_9ACTN|nr:hypothetical protein [Streptomyces misionensis]TWV57106.1 hypothetical protein FRZ03_02925 [Streptomyces misionensis]